MFQDSTQNMTEHGTLFDRRTQNRTQNKEIPRTRTELEHEKNPSFLAHIRYNDKPYIFENSTKAMSFETFNEKRIANSSKNLSFMNEMNLLIWNLISETSFQYSYQF